MRSSLSSTASCSIASEGQYGRQRSFVASPFKACTYLATRDDRSCWGALSNSVPWPGLRRYPRSSRDTAEEHDPGANPQ
jgi:hypothetical protein